VVFRQFCFIYGIFMLFLDVCGILGAQKKAAPERSGTALIARNLDNWDVWVARVASA
jgi:hypothetical protein